MKKLDRKRKGWNVYLHTFDSSESFQCHYKFFFLLDWWKYKSERYGNHFSGSKFNYSYKGICIRIACSLISKKVLEIELINNQHEYLKFLKQEWDDPKAKHIQWALRK